MSLPLAKSPAIRSKALRNSAQGESCTVEVLNVCNHDPATTVLAHLPDESGTGKMGGKTDDWCAVFACSACHEWLDQHKGGPEQRVCRVWYMRRAMVRTWRRWIERGLIEVVR